MQVAQDIAVSFSPDGGTSAGAPTYLEDYDQYPALASVTVSCSASAVWNWSYSGDAPISSLGSGGSATSITFSLSSDYYISYNSTISLSGTAGGITRYWSISLSTFGIG